MLNYLKKVKFFLTRWAFSVQILNICSVQFLNLLSEAWQSSSGQGRLTDSALDG
jgi:uncharacterized protein affecting Mg2+/Co2+ transport